MARRALTPVVAATIVALVAISVLSSRSSPPSTGPGLISEARPLAPGLAANFTEGSVLTGTCRRIAATVTLTGNATGGVPPYNFTWYFGPDSPLSYGRETNHTYTVPGAYNVTLWVLDSAKNNASVTQPVYAPSPPCPVPVPGSPWLAAPAPWWQVYLVYATTAAGLATLGVLVWLRRKG
jgi:PKD repeat protein